MGRKRSMRGRGRARPRRRAAPNRDRPVPSPSAILPDRTRRGPGRRGGQRECGVQRFAQRVGRHPDERRIDRGEHGRGRRGAWPAGAAARARQSARCRRAPRQACASCTRRGTWSTGTVTCSGGQERADSRAPGRTAARCPVVARRPDSGSPSPRARLRPSAEIFALVVGQRSGDPVEQREREPQRQPSADAGDDPPPARRSPPSFEPQRGNLLRDQADQKDHDREQDQQHRRVGDVALRGDRPGRVGRADQ